MGRINRLISTKRAHGGNRTGRARPRPRAGGPGRHPPPAPGSPRARGAPPPTGRRRCAGSSAHGGRGGRPPPLAQPAALRGPGRLLPDRPRLAHEVLGRLLARGRHRPSTRPRRRCCASPRERAGHRERPPHPRARLRLGQLLALGGRALPGLAAWWASPTRRASASSSSARRRRRGLANVEIVTCDMNRFEAARHLRPGGLGGDVRAHAQLAGALPAHLRLARPRRQALHPRLRRAPASPTSSRPTPTTTGWGATSSPAA